MSLAIAIDQISAVLLADGWHQVAERSFELDTYEYVERLGEDRNPRHRFGGGEGTGAPKTGFTFTEELQNIGAFGHKAMIKGPVSSILAIRESRN